MNIENNSCPLKPFFQYLCLCTGSNDIGLIKYGKISPYYGDIDVLVTDSEGTTHNLEVSIFANSARIHDLPKILQDRGYYINIENSILYELDSMHGLDRCPDCGSYSQVIKFGYPFHKMGKLTEADSCRYGKCSDCGSMHPLFLFIVINNFLHR